MINQESEFTNEQIQQRAKENQKNYLDARKLVELGFITDIEESYNW